MNKCEFCGFEVIALKRYIAIQELNKHKETCCKIIKCAECDFIPSDRMSLKRHMRDLHEV